MKKRVFICADVFFPHGEAGANRIRYLAMALGEQNADVYLLARQKEPVPGEDTASGWIDLPGFRCKPVSFGGSLPGKLRCVLFRGRSMAKELKPLHAGRDDVFLIYGKNPLFVAQVRRFARSVGAKVFLDVVEWHQPYQYRFGRFSPVWRMIDHTFSRLAPRMDGILTVSSFLADHFRACGKPAEVFPPMTDASEYTLGSRTVCGKETLDLIYPGIPFYKEDVLVMLKGILSLPEEERGRIRLHLTGLTSGEMAAYLKDEAALLQELSGVIVYHGWLTREDLLDLYSHMDFVFFSRPVNTVTKANFPSKIPELMCRGIVPVCNKAGDFYRYLEDGSNAVLFDRDDTGACSAALSAAVHMDPAVLARMKENARACASSVFDYRVWGERLVSFLLGSGELT